MRLQYAVCAERIIVDSATNRVTAVNLYDYFVAREFPAKIPQLMFMIGVSKSAAEKEEWDCVAEIYVDQDKILEGPLNLSFQGSDKTRSVGNVENFVVPHPGTLEIRVNLEGQLFASWLFEVERAN